MPIEIEIYYSSARVLNPMAAFAAHMDLLKDQGVPYTEAIRTSYDRFPECHHLAKLDGDHLVIHRDNLFSDWSPASVFLGFRTTTGFQKVGFFENIVAIAEKVAQYNLGLVTSDELIAGLPEPQKNEVKKAIAQLTMWPTGAFDFSRPGIHRLQHASCLIRSKTTGVLADPTFQTFVPHLKGPTLLAKDIVPHVDAIVITHSHDDHFHLPSLLHFRKDIPIYLPRVPVSSLASIDMHAILQNAGFTNLHIADWNTRFRVGDIEVEVLPFYGEQTSASQEIYLDLINWGNTYVFRTPDISCWLLVDSGQDIRGNMVDVAKKLESEGRSVDILLARLYFMKMERNVSMGGSMYWLCLSPEQRARFHAQTEPEYITLGPPGFAVMAEILSPKVILPHTHNHIEVTETLAYEFHAEAMWRQLSQLHGLTTPFHHWNVGDRDPLSR